MEMLLPVLFTVLVVIRAEHTGSRSVQFEYFDVNNNYMQKVGGGCWGGMCAKPQDYLLTMTVPKDVKDVNEESHQSTISPDDAVTPATSQAMSYSDIVGYFRDVPREHWSCCMLGMLAGNKGFHCNAAFYAARIATRNTNRAHNRNLPFHGRDRIPNWGRQIMHTFSRCVLHHSEEFHKCCYASTVERRERVRWQAYRDHVFTDEFPLDDMIVNED